MGSTDPRGEGDVKGWAKGHNPGYEAMLEEYHRKMLQAESIKEDIAAGAKIDPVFIIKVAVPLIMKWLPKLADGLQKSAEQVRTLAAAMHQVNGDPLSGVRAEYEKPSEADLLAAKFGEDVFLDVNPSKSLSAMEEDRLRWVEELKQYEVRDGFAKWPMRSVPEFIPDPVTPKSGRWIPNPTYARLVREGRGPGTAVPLKSEPERGASDGGRTGFGGTEAGQG